MSRGEKSKQNPGDLWYHHGSYHKPTERQQTERRVRFKPQGIIHGGFPKKFENGVKSRQNHGLYSGDLRYRLNSCSYHKPPGQSTERRVRFKPPGVGHGGFKKKLEIIRKLLPSPFGWYQVKIYSVIPFDQKCYKNEIIQYLLNETEDMFMPYYWQQEKNCISFFVNDFNIAERLRKIDCASMIAGFNLTVKIHSGIPIVNCNEPLKERLKMVIGKRYNAQTKSLNLTKFYDDPDLKDIFCGLFRPVLLAAVIDIIEKNIPDLETLNLNNNQIKQLDVFKNCPEKLPHLKILYLAENKIKVIENLPTFCGSSILEMVLANNPIRNHYENHKDYINKLRKKFPKLLKLDGKNLEPVIGFCVSDSTTLPRPISAFFCNPNEGAGIIREFIKEYFKIYDSDNRQTLLIAYHEKALLSLSCQLYSQGRKLPSYCSYNRNLMRQNDHDAKFRLLKTGRLSVVSFLSELPKTQHDLVSFSVDLSIFLPTLISFTVAGLFKEFHNDSSSSTEIRSFQRHIVIIPAGGGFLIRNEMIIISNATHVQVRSFLKEPQQQIKIESFLDNDQTPELSLLDSMKHLTLLNSMEIQPILTTEETSSVILPNEETKLQMIQAMSANSTMNPEWSKKCLEETNWNFFNANFVFNKLHQENKIPEEAFLKM